MSIKFKSFTALALSIVAGASSAHADNSYLPYYVQNRDSLQYISAAPPQTAGVPAVSQSNPGQPTNWQQPVYTVQPSAASQNDDWHSQPALFHFNNELWVAAGTSFLNYKEAVKPLPDGERGWLGSLAAGGSFMTTNNLYLSLDGSTSFGNGSYVGALLASPSTRAVTTTHETIDTLDGKIGQGIYLQQNVMAIPYADVGYRYWKRDFGNSEIEDYHNFDVLGGLMMQVAPTDRLIFSAYGSAGTTIGGKMKNGGLSFDLGDSMMYKVGGKAAVELTRQFELFSTIDYDHFHYSKSPNNSGYIEPGSRTSDLVMRAGIGYHFR